MATSLTPTEYARRARIYAAAKEDAAELTRLRAENAALRAAGQAVVETYSMMDGKGLTLAVHALRDALKEGGGE
jgi:hypothetical protein